jgi:ABC-type multidrug transport system fused ATPase/permease subunit
VQQEPFLFNDTIYKNVAYGFIGTEWEDAEEEKKRELVAQACKEAYADEFISRLPDVSEFPSINYSAHTDSVLNFVFPGL